MSLTRRHLLVAAGAGAAASLAPSPKASAAAPGAPPLPPPLPADTFRERQARLRAEAKTRGIDVLILTPSTNLAYTANLAIGRSERLTALLLFADGPAVLVTPAFEEANHRRTLVVDDVKTWAEEQDPIALVARTVEGRKTFRRMAKSHGAWLAELLADFPADRFDGLIGELDDLKGAVRDALQKP